MGLLAAIGVPGAAGGQSVVVGETALGAVGMLARADFWGAEAGLARRVGQSRIALAAAGGEQGGAAAMRVELRAQFLLLPPARTAVGYYAGLGLAVAEAVRRHGGAYLTAVVGVETAVWHARGVYAELGLGGGVRMAAGVRWRRVPAWWP